MSICESIAVLHSRYLLSSDVQAVIRRARGDVQVLGVTLDWSLKPTRLFEWPDGFRGIVTGDRRLSPTAYDASGWPVDPHGVRLEIAA